MTDLELTDLLAELGAKLDRELGASGGDLVPDVLTRLDDGRPAARSFRRPSPWLLAAASALLVLTVAVAVPGTRRTVARWFGTGSVRIERVPTTTVTAPTAAPEPPDLGPAVAADEAIAATGLPLPSATVLGEPTSWHLPGGPQIVARHDVDGRTILVASLAGASDVEMFAKQVSADAVEIEYVDVDGTPGVWIHGEPHWFGYLGPDGEFAEEPLRLASDTLLWDRGSVMYRVEGAADLGEALEIAQSMER